MRDGHGKNKTRQDLTLKTARKEVSKESPRNRQRAKAESAASREASQASKARPKKITRSESVDPALTATVSLTGVTPGDGWWDGTRLIAMPKESAKRR